MADAAYVGTPDRFAQYDIARQRAQQQGLAAKQQNNEAIRRRFASIGNLNSGAAIKAAGQADQAADAQTQAGVQDVDSQEQQARNQLADVQQAQQFQAGESQKTRDLQSSQFDKTYDLQRQDFAESQKANALNAQFGLAAADLNDVGKNPQKMAQFLKNLGY